MQNNTTEKLKKHSQEIQKRFKVKRIGIFGSQIKGKAKEKSDVDVLVEFEPDGETLEEIFHKAALTIAAEFGR